MGFDRRALEAEIDGCVASQRRLIEYLRSADDLDPRSLSRLPGWTVGHVLTHLARNADSHLEMLSGRPQYHDAATRDREIESGAGRDVRDLIDDVDQSSTELAAAWAAALESPNAEAIWSGMATALSGPRPMRLLPLLRWREVEIHRMDLGTGFEAGDLDRHYLRCDLRVSEMLWRARRPIGLTPLPQGVLAVPPHLRLLWFLGRHEIDGVGAVT